MAGVNTTFGNNILNYIRGVQLPTPPSAVYIGFFNGDPDAGGTEVTTSIRTAGRVAATFSAASAKKITNSAAVDFGVCAGSVTITHNALFDAQSGGNILVSKQLSAQRQTAQGDPLSYPQNSLSYQIP